MIDFLDTPIFGVLFSILAFEIGLYAYRRMKKAVFNPLLIAITIIVFTLLAFNIPLEHYNRGGGLITFFLGPATVILAVPLYRQLALLRTNLIPILGGIVAGCITAITSVWLMAKLFDVEPRIILSIVPKSVTTPIGIEISNQLGGISSLTVATIVIAGIMGAVMGPVICRLFGIQDEVAVGVAMGTASHALGTTKAMELGEIQGAMSGLSIGIAGLVTVFLAPLLINLFLKI